MHPEGAEMITDKLAVPRKASPEDKTPSPGETIAPKISALLAKECMPAESRPMTLYGYNAAARLPFTFSHARERRSLRAAPRPAPPGRMVRSASSGAAPHAPAPAITPARQHKPLVDPPPPGLHLAVAEIFLHYVEDFQTTLDIIIMISTTYTDTVDTMTITDPSFY